MESVGGRESDRTQCQGARQTSRPSDLWPVFNIEEEGMMLPARPVGRVAHPLLTAGCPSSWGSARPGGEAASLTSVSHPRPQRLQPPSPPSLDTVTRTSGDAGGKVFGRHLAQTPQVRPMAGMTLPEWPGIVSLVPMPGQEAAQKKVASGAPLESPSLPRAQVLPWNKNVAFLSWDSI